MEAKNATEITALLDPALEGASLTFNSSHSMMSRLRVALEINVSESS